MQELALVSILISLVPTFCDVSGVNDTLDSLDNSCIDREGRYVPNGARYAPDDDPCKSCYCADGVAQLCTLVQCSSPVCARWRAVLNECCQFECLDDQRGSDADRNSTLNRYGLSSFDSVNIDMRLALSGTTTLLIIALLVFMVHRLRQRRLLIIMRRMTEDQHCIEHEDSVYGADDLAGFEFLAYKDPPPPYSSPQGTLSRHYDPPPYETAAGMIEPLSETMHDANRVHIDRVGLSLSTSSDNNVECELPIRTHIIQTRM